MPKISELKKELKKHSNKRDAAISQRFFKTGKGEYGEGDIFLGIKTAVTKEIAKKYMDISLTENEKLLQSNIHTHRGVALRILIHKFEKADEKLRNEIYKLYLRNTKYINNWDLVDISAPNIVGVYLLDKDRKILYKLARSKDLWEKRISILSTYTFIRNNDYKDTLKISEILLNDDHDLIHKAVGWMLREVGNRNRKVEEKFLDKYTLKMPRTMLRYAIEKFPEPKRQYYLKKK
ncbi:DNA alkylation repair protein [Patescibacteria group bacterium]